MSRKQKKMLARILLSAGLFVAIAVCCHFVQLPWWLALPLYLVPYFIIGYDVLWDAARNIIQGQVFDENFLMCIATVGAFALLDFDEAVFVMLFYQVGELFQSYAVGKSRRSIAALMDIRPDVAYVERDGEVEEVDPDDVAVDDVIVVRPGEKIPLDGVVLEGNSSVNTTALTGESVPRTVRAGEEVISGCVNLEGLLRVRVTKPFGESTVSKILELVENSSANKARTEQFITRFARWYTPTVVIAAVLLALVPPLFLGGWGEWFRRALMFLVISCPCALVISVPMSFFGGIGGASRCGILVKGSNYLEQLAKCSTVVFDKTGTLTRGTFRVTEVRAAMGERNDLLYLAACAEQYSNHPIAESIKAANLRPVPTELLGEVTEIAGQGVCADVNGTKVFAGNLRLMKTAGVECHEVESAGTVVYLAANDKFLGSIVIADEMKEDSKQAIASLKAIGVEKTVMLTGDRHSVGVVVGRALDIDEVHTELFPEDKVRIVEELLTKQPRGTTLAFVGDGINDAPVLSRADVGIAMGALGSDAAIEAADVVLMDDQPSKIALAMRIARKTVGIVRQNIVFALGIKLFFLLLSALGLANMWVAVFADVGVAVIAILNAMRALYISKK
ncbi:MAG: cadmium-translocating P-type ATPase [Clostridia bacterium]|nr:cadmium-translocating P-type ATPase [Clostridia bacterium]